MQASNWLVEECKKCDTEVSQSPVFEDEQGDDCMANQELADYKQHQKGENPYKCDCGSPLFARIVRS